METGWVASHFKDWRTSATLPASCFSYSSQIPSVSSDEVATSVPSRSNVPCCRWFSFFVVYCSNLALASAPAYMLSFPFSFQALLRATLGGVQRLL